MLKSYDPSMHGYVPNFHQPSSHLRTTSKAHISLSSNDSVQCAYRVAWAVIPRFKSGLVIYCIGRPILSLKKHCTDAYNRYYNISPRRSE